MTGATPADGGVDVYTSKEIRLQNVAFVELLGFDLDPRHRGGVIRVTAQLLQATGIVPGITPHPLVEFYNFITVDVRIVGFVGATPVAMHRAELGGDASAIDFRVPRDTPYKRIAVMARLMIDGEPTKRYGTAFLPPGNTPPMATSGAVARMARS